MSCFFTGDVGPVPTLLWWPCVLASAEAAAGSPMYWKRGNSQAQLGDLSGFSASRPWLHV